jgi:hypothetical protein
MSEQREARDPSGPAVTGWLAAASPRTVAVVGLVAGFGAYFATYGFRKPFLAARYDGLVLFDGAMGAKAAFVIAQVIGYAASKFISVRVGSELPRAQIHRAIALCLGAALGGLVLFGLLPLSLKPLAMAVNGLPLGLVWGFVVRYLEGRKSSEILLAGLSASYIVASGAVKDVGRAVIRSGAVGEFWMPTVTALMFTPLLVVCVAVLAALPPPTRADEATRMRRTPMDAAARAAFVRRFFPGLVGLFAAYLLVTAYRDYRDAYTVELLAELGATDAAGVMTRIELPVAIGVVSALALLNLVADNRRGLIATFGVMGLGVAALALATPLLAASRLDAVGYLMLTGVGSFLIYVPFGALLFDRLIAATGIAGTAVFAINLADAIGYTGSVAVQLAKDRGAGALGHAAFFSRLTQATALVAALGLGFALVYFLERTRRVAPVAATPEEVLT